MWQERVRFCCLGWLVGSPPSIQDPAMFSWVVSPDQHLQVWSLKAQVGKFIPSAFIMPLSSRLSLPVPHHRDCTHHVRVWLRLSPQCLVDALTNIHLPSL